jgi:DNA-binding transcriptional LysR family regulator
METGFSDMQALRTFVAVAHEGSVSRAAERLHRSQPAVSLQLKRLAEDLGVTLFVRTARGLALSADGAALLPQAERVIGAAGDFRLAVSRLKGTVRGRLRIGTILDPQFTRLGAFLRDFVESTPQVETELRHGMSGDVLAQVLRGDLDVGFYLSLTRAESLAVQPALDVRSLTRFDYRVVAPAGWGPQVQDRDWPALAALPWLRTPPESVHHRLLSSVFDPLGVDPPRAALVDQESSMLDLLKSGVGLSLVRDAVAMRESQTDGLVIADRVKLSCELQFICLATRSAEPAIGRAFDALRRVWG